MCYYPAEVGRNQTCLKYKTYTDDDPCIVGSKCDNATDTCVCLEITTDTGSSCG